MKYKKPVLSQRWPRNAHTECLSCLFTESDTCSQAQQGLVCKIDL